MLYIGTPKKRTFDVSKFRMFGTIRLLNKKINPVTVAFTLRCFVCFHCRRYFILMWTSLLALFGRWIILIERLCLFDLMMMIFFERPWVPPSGWEKLRLLQLSLPVIQYIQGRGKQPHTECITRYDWPITWHHREIGKDYCCHCHYYW